MSHLRAPILFLALAVSALSVGPPALAQETGDPQGHPPWPTSRVSAGSGEITISLPHLLIEAKENGTRGVSAYVLRAAPETEATGTAGPLQFIFGLPVGATAPSRVQAAGAPHPFPPERIRKVSEEGTWAVELPQWEGEIQVVVEALSPLRVGEAGFRQQFFYPVTGLTVLVRPPDLVLAGKGLEFAGIIEPMQVSQWVGQPIEAGGFLDLHVHEHAVTTTGEEKSEILPLANRTMMPRVLLFLVFLGFLVFAVAVSLRRST